MKHDIRIYSAEPIGNDPRSTATIEIDNITPRLKGLADQDALYQTEAEKLEDALFNTLPGGIYDRLCGCMLRRKSTHFIVSHAAAFSETTAKVAH